MQSGLSELEILVKNNVSNPDKCIFLHPGDLRSYTDDELACLNDRDFETRLFITGTQCGGDCSFLRSHHTDNVGHSSNFNYVRDYIKAFHVVKNWTCAKSVLTTLLTMCFQLDESDYYSFAITIASGLSENAKNTDFETNSSSRTLATPGSTVTMDSKELENIDENLDLDISNGKVRNDLEVKEFDNGAEGLNMSDLSTSSRVKVTFVDNPLESDEKKTEDVSCKIEGDSIKFPRRKAQARFQSQQMLATDTNDHSIIRSKFCFLMDIVFKRLSIRKFLVDDERSNIYRLVHCKTKYSKNKKPLFIALFAFVLQISLATYIVLEFVNGMEDGEEDGEEDDIQKYKMLPLAIFTAVHSFMVAVPNFNEALVAYRIFGRIGVLQMMDFTMSAIIPLLLTVTGFFVIFREKSFIEGVINSTALLFIPEIDDQLPSILGLRTEEIVKNFLVAESITTFDEIARLTDTDFNTDEQKKRNVVSGVQFSDFYITNLPEQGMTDDTPFQPYQVTADDNGMGHQIDPSSFVTSGCLLKRIEWKYSTGYPNTTKPRVAYLHLTKIDDTVVEIERKQDPSGFVGISNVSHALEGMFIITTFQMSEDIIKLRACGSFNPRDFLAAFDCYSLWDLSDAARRAIMSLPDVKEKKNDGLHNYSYDRFEDV